MTNHIIPEHIGFILDGNRRWAKKRNLPTLEGHRAGYNRLIDLAHFAKNSGVKYVSAFVFSTENWNRSKEEVDYLMGLLLKMFMRDAKKLVREGFRVVVLQKRLPAKGALFAKIQKRIDELEQLSAQLSDKDFNGTTLALCFNYGGHMEIVEAAEKLAASGQEFTEENFAKFIYHPEIPACDLIVRTSGEERISGFQLWRAAYAEFMFVDKNWPDFSEEDFTNVLGEFSLRSRRFGK